MSKTNTVPLAAPRPPRAGRMSAWLPVLLVVLIALAWSNTFNAPFELDDDSSIASNPTLRDLTSFHWLTPPSSRGETVSGRPVLNGSFAVNVALGGMDVRGFHAGNLLIHTIAGLLLFGVVRRIFRANRLRRGQPDDAASDPGLEHVGAFVVAVIWALHPLQTQAVTYIVQRAESLMALFYLLTLYCFLRAYGVGDDAAEGAPTRRGWIVGSIIACALGMGTKENMVSAPIAVWLLDRALMGGEFQAIWRRRPAYYAALFSTWLVVLALLVTTGGNRGGSAGFDVGVRWADYALTQFPALARYAALALWPSGLVFEYGAFWVRDAAAVMGPMLLVAAMLLGAAYALVRRPLAGWVAFVGLAVLAPTSLVPGTLQMIVEHRMYLPLASVVGLIALAIGAVLGRRQARQVLSAGLALALALAGLTFARNRVYATSLELWADTVAKRPDNPRGHNNLGLALRKAGRGDEAMAEFRRAIALEPNHAFAHANLGVSLLERREWAPAAAAFEAALQADPEAVDARLNLAVALTHLGRRDEAVAAYRAVLRRQPQAADAQAAFAGLLLDQGQVAEAEALVRQALASSPGLAVAHLQFGRVLERKDALAEAGREYATAVEQDPSLGAAHLALGNLRLRERDLAGAEASYREAVRCDPEWAEPRYALGNVFARRQQWEPAIASFQEALAREPRHVDALNNLANCELMLGRIGDAIGHYEKVLAARPGDAAVTRNLALARELLRSGQR